jgi:long-chain acyl-CoA synthetase
MPTRAQQLNLFRYVTRLAAEHQTKSVGNFEVGDLEPRNRRSASRMVDCMDVISAFLRTVRQQPDSIAIIDGDERVSWRELAERIGIVAAALRRFGVRRESTVAILSLSSTKVFELFYAVPWAGGRFCPLNYRLTTTEIIEIVEDANVEILFVDEAFVDSVPTLKASARHIIFVGAGQAPEGMIDYESLLGEAQALRHSDCSEEDVACLYYTGGTTGKAKGVMLTHRNIFANALNFALATNLTEQDRVLHCGPMFHVASGSRVYNAGIFGASNVIIPRFEAHDVLKNIELHQVSVVSLVPTMLNTIVHLHDFGSYDVSSLRMILYGASQISPALLDTAMSKFDGVAFCQAYGQTEVAPFATVLAPRYHCLDGPLSGKLRSVGRPIGSVEVRVVDTDDSDLPTGTVGEIIIRGPNVMKGYLNKPELTAIALRGGWMHSGDLGFFDEDGFLYVVDRAKDMIISGGENIYSVEVENAISAHPAVSECAVFGIPDIQWGETVHAVIVLKKDYRLESSDIIQHCRRLIGGFKLPRSIEFRNEPMPLSGANKILKNTLRDAYLASRTG